MIITITNIIIMIITITNIIIIVIIIGDHTIIITTNIIFTFICSITYR
jgi:hypothetical protein